MSKVTIFENVNAVLWIYLLKKDTSTILNTNYDGS